MHILFVHEELAVCQKIQYYFNKHVRCAIAQCLDDVSQEECQQYDCVLIDKLSHIPSHLTLNCYFYIGFHTTTEKDFLRYDNSITTILQTIQRQLDKNRMNNQLNHYTQRLKTSEYSNQTIENANAVTVSSVTTDHTPTSKIVMFIGARGNVGTSVVATHCANYLKQFGKVFYMSFLPFQQNVPIDTDNTNKKATLSQLLLALDTQQTITLTDYIIHWDDIAYFVPFEQPTDYFALTQHDVSQLLEQLNTLNAFDYIVIDSCLLDKHTVSGAINDAQKLFVIDTKCTYQQLEQFIQRISNVDVQMKQMYYIRQCVSPNVVATTNQGFDVVIPYSQHVQHDETVQTLLTTKWQVYL